jgi:hypothetical protein
MPSSSAQSGVGAPGSAQGLYLIVSDIEAARARWRRGVDMGGPRGCAGLIPRPRPCRRAGARSQHLRLVRRVQRSRWKRLAAPGDHRTPSRSRRSQRDDIQLRRRPGQGARARFDSARRAREADGHG